MIQSICLPLLSVYEGPANGATQVPFRYLNSHFSISAVIKQTLFDFMMVLDHCDISKI